MLDRLNMIAATIETPRIKLYTNHSCPWAHRAHIALAELQLPYDEEIIDLYKPRTPEYLQVNPRGQVPTMIFDGQTITESAIVSRFLADLHPSNLLPGSAEAQGPLTRAKINFFVDTYFSKAQGHWEKMLAAKTNEVEDMAAKAYVDAVVKDVEPLLADAAPFFGGSEKLTLAEVLTGSWVLRVYALSQRGIVPTAVIDGLATRAPNFDRWAQQVIKHPSVLSIWDEEQIIASTKGWIEKMRAS